MRSHAVAGLPYTVRLRRRRGEVVAIGELAITPQLKVAAAVGVDESALRRWVKGAMRGEDGGDPIMVGGILDDIGGALSDVWEGAKGVASDIVNSSVLRKVANTVSDPRFQGLLSVIPGVGPVAAHATAQVGTAWNGLRAATAGNAGRPDIARQISEFSAAQAAALGIPAADFNAAQQFGANLAVDPAMLATVQQLIPGGVQTLVRHYASPPIPVPPVAVPRAPVPRVAVPRGGRPVPRVAVPRMAVPRGGRPVPKRAIASGQARLATQVDYTSPLPSMLPAPASQLLRAHLLGHTGNPVAWGASGPAAAIVRYQRLVGLPVTGRVDAATRDRALKLGAVLPQPTF